MPGISRKQRIFILVSFVLTLGSLVLFVPWGVLVAGMTPLQKSIPQLLNDATDRGLDGIIVYIDQGGRDPEFHSSGWKNREAEIPADPDALFKIASITKLYVAAAAAKLADDQVLSLDKTLEDYLPSMAGKIENSDQITLRMMLQHRSGIPDFIDNPEYAWFTPHRDSDEAIELVFNLPSEFNPDSRYKYSNTNYMLIGEIINAALGYEYRQYIEDEILDPLGLKRTFDSLSDINPDELASGYDTGYCCDLKMINYTGAAGSMISTAEEVGIFLRALNDGSLLTDSEQAIYGSIYEYGHTGLVPGYSSIARYDKDTDTVLIQFANTSGADTWALTEMVYRRILRILRTR